MLTLFPISPPLNVSIFISQCDTVTDRGMFSQFQRFFKSINFAPGQLIVGGFDGNYLSSVELFPRPSSDACSVPDLPQGRLGHSLSLLSGGRLVVCGGHDAFNYLDSCLSWDAGQTSWTDIFKMRLVHQHFSKNQKPNPQLGEK